MTGAEFSEVDFDLLADYVGGALDGTPDEAVVAALIVGHPGWRRAHADLVEATGAMTAALQAWGAEPEPMPADVVARLDAAFAATAGGGSIGDEATALGEVRSAGSGGESIGGQTAALGDGRVAGSGSEAAAVGESRGAGSGGDAIGGEAAVPVGPRLVSVDAAGLGDADGHRETDGPGNAAGAGDGLRGAAGLDGVGAAGGPARPLTTSDGAASGRHLVAVPNDDAHSTTARKRARRLKWAAPIGIAAGLVAFLGFGVQQFGSTDSQDAATSSAAGSADQGGSEANALALPAGPAQVLASGTDYDKQTLGQAAARAMSAPLGGASSEVPRPVAPEIADSQGKRNAADDPLNRLRVQEALLACLDAISVANDAGPITAQSVDYARYEGAPALIVQFTAGNGSWVWATGANCGASGSAADKLGAAKVG